MEGRWRIELFGWLRGTLDETVVSRFRTHNAGVLLAYLAHHKDRSHPREELGAMLWPEADEATTRARLRIALTGLRHQFEPPSLPKGSVFLASGSHLQLNPAMASTDVEEFESLLLEAEIAENPRELLERAVALYRGEFLPGFYEDWVLAERQRLADLLEGALDQLTDLCSEEGLHQRGLSYARKLVAMNPWAEDRHCRIIRLCLQSGNAAAAVRQDREMRTMLAELGEEPSEGAQKLTEKLGKLTLEANQDSVWNPPTDAKPVQGSKLPVRLTRFFGRTEETTQILTRFQEAKGRLVTLTGAGGCGKTRLSVETGYALDALGWSVWFIPLADVGSPARIYDAILTGLKVERSQDPLKHLRQFFAAHAKPLLILDNFEHLMDDGALVVKRLMSEIPNLSCLVSSRQRLALEGEMEIMVSPLLAPLGADITPEQAALFPCIQLYVDRCQALRPDFQITERNAKAIANLCARLEGIPLAIEIASSLSQSLSPAQMIEQLDKRLDLLTSPRRDIVQRHKTLRNAVAYSYDLLTPLQQKLFASLAVFRGGWTIRSATEICFKPLARGEDCFSLLLQLRERSLIETYETPTGEMRFRMLETFRDFGRDCLKPPEWEELTKRHDQYFVKMAEEAYKSLRTPNEQSSMDGLHADYDNLMNVLERTLENKAPELGIRLAIGFSQIWRSRGAVAHEQAIMKELVKLAEAKPIGPELIMRGLNALSHASYLLCDWPTSIAAEERTLELALQHQNDEYCAMACAGLAIAQMGQGRFGEAKEMLLKSADYIRKSGIDYRQPVILGNLGFTMWREGNLEQAEQYFRETLALCEKLNQRPQANFHRLNIARILLDRGLYEEAFEQMSGCVERALKLHRVHDFVMALVLLAKYYRLTGDLGRAEAIAQQALQRVFALMNENSEMYLAVELGQILARQGKWAGATTLLSALGKISLSAVDQRDVERTLQECREELGQKEFDLYWAKGVASTIRDALQEQVRVEAASPA